MLKFTKSEIEITKTHTKSFFLTHKILFIMKRLILISTAVIYLLFACSNTVAAQERECGWNITWTFDENTGCLSLNGYNSMYDNYKFSNYIDINKVKSISIEDGITYIGLNSFLKFGQLEEPVVIPNSVKKMNGYIFFNCYKLKEIVLGNSLEFIGVFTFANCYALTEVTLPNSITIIGDGLFSSCKGLKKVNLSNSLTYIPGKCFRDCESLTEITLPATITEVQRDAFLRCKNLEKIVCLATVPPTVGTDVFTDIKSGCVLVVPEGCEDAYKEADGWKDLVVTTGVDEIPVDNRISVDVANGDIVISGADLNMRAAVYNLSGSLVYEGVEKTISMPASGIYIVRIADKSFKVAVK